MSPNALTSRTLFQRGKLVVGGLIAAGVIGGGIFLPKLSTTGSETNQAFAAFLPIVADVTATGSTSTSARYDAACITNPLYGLGLGSGSVVRLTYHNVTSPAAIGGDIGFVSACDSKSASGAGLIDNVCTATGCISTYTTGTALWNAAEKIKLTLRGDPTSSYDAKITVWVEDVLGE